MLIVTIPGPQNEEQLNAVIQNPLIDGFRFNTGVRVPYSPLVTLELLLDKVGSRDFWLDIKGRQLRIIQWSDPEFGKILLNHNIEVELPAEVYFRGDDICQVTSVIKNQIFVYPNPRYALGSGQSINIHSQKLTIEGYLTEEDKLYLEAAKELGINKIMLSFVESNNDIELIQQYCPDAEMYLKIESPQGLDFVNSEYVSTPKIHLMAARDDLFINLENKFEIISALKLIIKKDPDAIVASRILISLINSREISLGDIADLTLLHQMGYENFMFSDSLSSHPNVFNQAMEYWKEFEIKKWR